jgi:hypothetical protein
MAACNWADQLVLNAGLNSAVRLVVVCLLLIELNRQGAAAPPEILGDAGVVVRRSLVDAGTDCRTRQRLRRRVRVGHVAQLRGE